MRDGERRGQPYLSRFPVAFRPPAFASRSSDSRRGVGPSLRSAYRTRPKARPDPDGVTTFRTHELRPGWVPSKPRGRRCSSQTEGRAQPAPAALRRPVLRPALAHPSCGLPFTRHQRGFTRFTRPDCPSPVATGMERSPLGFPRSFTPRRPGADESRRGGARPSSTNLELPAQLTSVDPPIGSSLIACDLASHRP